ncbi:MAG: aldo/keto reductase [Caldilineales bacterium]
MQQSTLGNTGIKVSRLGVGLSELGDLPLSEERTAARVLYTALDNGVNFFDTAACYGNSEELFGRRMRRPAG